MVKLKDMPALLQTLMAFDRLAKGGRRLAMSVDHLRAMARNNAWSNYRLHNACAQLSDAEYGRSG
jgi:hypothetical protein